MASLREKVSSLEDERKEFEVTIADLQRANQELKLKSLNPDNYEEWGPEEVTHWIVSIDPGMYGQYEQALTKSLKEEEVKGADLGDVDMTRRRPTIQVLRGFHGDRRHSNRPRRRRRLRPAL